MGLCSCLRPKPDNTAPLLSVAAHQQQEKFNFPSLNAMFRDATQIRNVAWIARAKECCTIETNQNYYHAHIENSKRAPLEKEPKLGLWMSIKQLFASLLISWQSWEKALKERVNWAIPVTETILNASVTEASCRHEVMYGQFCNILAYNRSLQVTTEKQQQDNNVLMKNLLILSQHIIDDMKTTENKGQLDNLTKAHSDLNDQLPLVLQSFVTGHHDVAFRTLWDVVNRHPVVLTGSLKNVKILNMLRSQLYY